MDINTFAERMENEKPCFSMAEISGVCRRIGDFYKDVPIIENPREYMMLIEEASELLELLHERNATKGWCYEESLRVLKRMRILEEAADCVISMEGVRIQNEKYMQKSPHRRKEGGKTYWDIHPSSQNVMMLDDRLMQGLLNIIKTTVKVMRDGDGKEMDDIVPYELVVKINEVQTLLKRFLSLFGFTDEDMLKAVCIKLNRDRDRNHSF